MLDLVKPDHAAVVFHILEGLVPTDNALGVFRLQVVLGAVLAEQTGGVADEHLAGGLRLLPDAQDQDARGEACPVEQFRCQADDGLDQVLLEQVSADLALDATSEQGALGQHHGHATGARGHRFDHVLDPGEIAGLIRWRTG